MHISFFSSNSHPLILVSIRSCLQQLLLWCFNYDALFSILSTYINWNSSIRNTCLLSLVYSPIHSLIRRHMDVYFILQIIIQYDHHLFSCLNCWSRGQWESFQVGSCVLSKSLLSSSEPLCTFWHKMLQAYSVFFLPWHWISHVSEDIRVLSIIQLHSRNITLAVAAWKTNGDCALRQTAQAEVPSQFGADISWQFSGAVVMVKRRQTPEVWKVEMRGLGIDRCWQVREEAATPATPRYLLGSLVVRNWHRQWRKTSWGRGSWADWV